MGKHTNWLGDPGEYVTRSAEAGATWRELGHEAVMTNIVGNVQLPGLRPPRTAARELTQYMFERADAPGLHLFFTHDSLVTATAAHALRASLTKAHWPLFLEAAFFWQDEELPTAASFVEESTGDCPIGRGGSSCVWR